LLAVTDAEAKAAVHPLFRCTASLGIPVMSVLPTPDEVQIAVVQAVKLIVGSLKRVAQWSLMYSDVVETDQLPTTSGNVTGAARHNASLDEGPSNLVHIRFPVYKVFVMGRIS